MPAPEQLDLMVPPQTTDLAGSLRAAALSGLPVMLEPEQAMILARFLDDVRAAVISGGARK